MDLTYNKQIFKEVKCMRAIGFKKGDVDSFFGVLFDGMPKIITGVVVLTPLLGATVVFKQLLPSIGLALLLSGIFFWWLGEETKRRTGNQDIVALPGGINAGRFFVWLFAIMIPVYQATGDAKLALFVGIGANIISSLISIVLAFTGQKLIEIIPSEALFGGLTGGALAWLTLATFKDMFGTPEMSIISMISVFIVLGTYLGKIKTKFSPALISVVVGVVLGFALSVIKLDAVKESFGNFGLYMPGGVVLSGGYFEYLVKGLVEAMKYLPIIIVFSFGETVSNIQGIEQARGLGDNYDIRSSLVGVNVISLISGFFGNPFSIGIWWGYPSWKEVKAGTGYQILHGAAYLILSITGIVAVVTSIIPVGAVLPILVFIGLASTQAAFSSYKPMFYGIMALGLAIPIGELSGAPEFISKGAMLIALVWGSALVYVAKNEWKKVSFSFVGGALLTVVGLMHTSSFIINFALDEAGNFGGITYSFGAWKAAVAYLAIAAIAYFFYKKDVISYEDAQKL
jgi:adenine/guanine/hypoxanthine permease